MAKLACLSSGSSSSVPTTGSGNLVSVPYSDLMSSIYSSYVASLNGFNPTKDSWRRFLLRPEYRDLLFRCYADYVLSDCADRVFTGLGRRLARSQSVPCQISLDETVIPLPPLLVVGESPRKGFKLYSTLRDATLGNFRYHIDFLTKNLEAQRLHLQSLEKAYAAFCGTVRGDMSARLRDIVGLFSGDK